jgi:hypothetical protein
VSLGIGTMLAIADIDLIMIAPHWVVDQVADDVC